MSRFSAARLSRELGISDRDAEKLRELVALPNHRRVDQALEFANKAMDLHGVEAVRDPSQWDEYYGDVVCLFVNTGDSYATTLVYDVQRDTFLVQGWADWVERYERRTGRRLP
jgi:hypothetical protein